MFRVFTRNSVYTVCPVTNGFRVTRSGDCWGRKVTVSHEHITDYLRVEIGFALHTSKLYTSPVLAIAAD